MKHIQFSTVFGHSLFLFIRDDIFFLLFHVTFSEIRIHFEITFVVFRPWLLIITTPCLSLFSIFKLFRIYFYSKTFFFENYFKLKFLMFILSIFKVLFFSLMLFLHLGFPFCFVLLSVLLRIQTTRMKLRSV